MSDNTTPIDPFFELQRETITQTVSLLTGPRRVRQSMTDDGVAASKQVQEQTLTLSRQATHRLLGATEALAPAGETNEQLHEGIDDAFDRLADHQTATFDTLEEFRQTADEQFGTRVVAQLALLLRANESLERQVSVSADQLEEALLDGENATADLECAVEQLAEALEAATSRLAPESAADGTAIPVTDEERSGAEGTEESGAEGAEEASEVGAEATSEKESAEESLADDEVRCRVCGDTFGAITHSHLQTHDMTLDAYTDEFADAPLRPEDRE